MCVSATQALISVDILYMLQACAPRLFFPSKGAQKRLQIWPLCGRQIVLAIFDLTQIFKTKAFYDLLAVNMPTYGSVCVQKYIIILHNYGERKQWHSPCFLHFFFVVVVLLTVNLHHFPHLHKFVSQTQHKHTE